MSAETILIASSRIDELHVNPVATKLHNRGFEVLVYEADRVAHGEAGLELTVDGQYGLRFVYQGEVVDLPDVGAAWYRRPYKFNDIIDDKGRQLTRDGARNDLQFGIWQAIPESAWLNEPGRMLKARQKISQLALAASIGLTVPRTVVCNDWRAARRLLDESNTGKIVFKPPKGITYINNEARAILTNVLDEQKLATLADAPVFPGIFQDYVAKEREWRLTIVGDKAFEAAIYTTDKAKDDWRNHEYPDVRYAKEKMPEGFVERCIAFLGKFGLKYGAFDGIEPPDGPIHFLELNPNGQFIWLENQLGLPISDAIADELAAIARTS